jgi:uncharacterized protein (DUF4415 family)
MSKSTIVKRTIDPTKVATVTKKQKARLAALAVLPDDEIDTSDIPPLSDTGWIKAAERPHGKRQITLRLDADVLDFFQHGGRRYQTRINAVLRAYVEAHKS